MTKELNETVLVLSQDCLRAGTESKRGEHDSKSQRE